MNLTNKDLAFRNAAWKCSVILILLLNVLHTYSEEVCKVFYKKFPEDLNGKELTVPKKTVALSEKVLVGTPTTIGEGYTQSASIFFIIDHSRSMEGAAKDRKGYRFTVPFTLMDTIQQLMPKAEVGIAVFKGELFFNEKDSPFFVKAPKSNNAYLPLMTLDSTYDNNETGYDIVRRYLDSELDNGIARLKYKPSVYIRDRTNINCAFDAAKHAMLSSKYSNKKQFIIFFSDGEANAPDLFSRNRFTNGVDTPTTFTIFFSRFGFVPASIQRMTENVKNNGYSLNNHLSKSWGYQNTTKDSLKNFLLNNVFQKIFTSTVAEPQKISVNGTMSADKWDGETFTFPEMIPLTDIVTDITEEINYTIKMDSSSKKENAGKENMDTSVSVGFTVKIEENARIQKNLLFECWRREIQFFYNNKPIEIADETMDELEIRFMEGKVDVLYGYENVTVDISNSATKKTDLEKFTLDDKGSYFSYKFTRKFNVEPEHGDKILDHAIEDSIIAYFQNPDLPLDIIRYGIPVRNSGNVRLKKGYYFDNNADGYIDSIFLTYKGEIIDNQAKKELIDFVTLPAYRGFELLDTKIYDNGVGLTVRQKDIKYDDRMITNVTKEDVLIIKNGILPSGGMAFADTVEIIDKMAPVIVNARLINHEDPAKTDTLIVTFSEPILKVTKHKPFYFWSSNPEDFLYISDLRLLKSDETTMTFAMRSIEGVTDPIVHVHNNDSIWIYWEDKQVGDKLLNYQHNKNNRRQILDIDQRYSDVTLVAKGVSPYNRDEPEKHIISSQILDILKKDNIADIRNSSIPNSGVLLRVTPKVSKKNDTKETNDFFLEGNVTIFDATGNTVLKNREMGYHANTKSLNFVWNGRNSYTRICGAGPYLALFKVIPYRGSTLHKMEEVHLKLLLVIK